MIIGAAVFHEHLATSPAMLAIQLCGAAIAIVGIAVLAPAAPELPADEDGPRVDSLAQVGRHR